MSKKKLSAEAKEYFKKYFPLQDINEKDGGFKALVRLLKYCEQLQMEKECLKWEIEEFKEVVKEVADRCRHNAAHIEDDPDMRQAWKENAEDLEALLTPKPEK